jgi:hypothetical protein
MYDWKIKRDEGITIVHEISTRDRIISLVRIISLCINTTRVIQTYPFKTNLDQYLWCHHACLSSWEIRVQFLVGPLLKVLK